MKIGIISQWFDPEPGPASLPGELARELVRRGHDVQVVTGFPNYPQGKIYAGYRNQLKFDEVADGVKIRRVGLYPSHDESAGGRVANYASFGLSAAINGVDCLMDRDAVWVSNSPPTVLLPMLRLKRAGVPTVLHVMDLWPDNIEASGLVGSARINKAMVAGIHKWNTRLYGLSDRVLVISPGVVDLLVSRGVAHSKLEYAPLWANESVFHQAEGETLRKEMGVADDTVVLLYAGAIGRIQGLDALVEALGMMPEPIAQKLECWFVGGGVWESELRNRVKHLPAGSPAVRVLGRKPMDEMPALTAAADLCFVGLRADKHARYSMPSKVQATLAMSRPLLASVPGDVHELVESEGIGFSSASGQSRELATRLAEAVGVGRDGLGSLGQHAGEIYTREFSLGAGAARIEEALSMVSRLAKKNLSAAGRVTVKPATMVDIPDIVEVHQRSFPGFFLTFLGPRFLELFYEGLCRDPNAVLLVASVDGRVIGFVGGVADEREFFRALKKARAKDFIHAAMSSALRRPSIIPRLWRARRRDSEIDAIDVPATLLSIGVDPGTQNLGLGRKLFNGFTATMESTGVSSFKLTTDARNNDQAVSFYEGLGLRRNRSFTTAEGRRMLEFLWTG